MPKSTDDLPDGFDAFWKVYPRRVEKQAAIRMYKRALKKTTAGQILTAAMQYARDRQGQDMQFTKHPASWINAQCWSDFGVEKQPDQAAPAGFYASFTSFELTAWDAYGKLTRGRSYPRDRNGGWYFPTQWPPHKEAAE